MKKLLILKATESSKQNAEKIAKLLVKRKIAACVSLQEIISIYSWEDEINKENEIEIVVKSKPEKLKILIQFLKKELSYDTPQLIYQIYESDLDYFKWVNNYVN